MTLEEIIDALDEAAEDGTTTVSVAVGQAISMLLDAHQRNFITDDGKVREMCKQHDGKPSVLPVTRDGMIVGCEAMVYGPGGKECLTHTRDCALALDVEVFDGQRTRAAWAWNECTGKRP